MRTLLLVLALAVGLLGLSPAAPATHCLSHDHGVAHAHLPAVTAAGAGPAASVAPHDHDHPASVAWQGPGDDHHDGGTRPASESCCHAAPTLIGGAEVGPAPSALAAVTPPAPRDVQGGGRPSFDIFRPPATA